jgi:hypothetical protein
MNVERGFSQFDLREVSELRAQDERPMRIALACASVLVIGIAIGFAALAVSAGVKDTLQAVVLLVIESCSLPLAAYLLYAIRRTGPGAIEVSAGHELVFRWRDQRVARLAWQSLGRELVMLDYSSNLLVSEYLPRLSWEVRLRGFPATSLTKVAFDGILNAARANGLDVSIENLEKPEKGWAPCQAVRFQPEDRKSR